MNITGPVNGGRAVERNRFEGLKSLRTGLIRYVTIQSAHSTNVNRAEPRTRLLGKIRSASAAQVMQVKKLRHCRRRRREGDDFANHIFRAGNVTSGIKEERKKREGGPPSPES